MVEKGEFPATVAFACKNIEQIDSEQRSIAFGAHLSTE